MGTDRREHSVEQYGQTISLASPILSRRVGDLAAAYPQCT